MNHPFDNLHFEKIDTGTIEFRCSTPTCVVCSRTCNASVPSNPPTPRPVWSSSSTQTSPNPPPLPSTRRVALALTSTNTNLGPITPTINITNNITTGVGVVVGPNSGSLLIGKRRKFTDDDVGGGVIDAGSLKPQENNLTAHANININGNVHHGDIEDHHQVPLSPGCGRVICRNCCFENSQKCALCLFFFFINHRAHFTRT